MLYYEVHGRDAAGKSWQVCGELHGDFDILAPKSLQQIGQYCFQQLTHGEATYGNPGQGGCHGPYSISKLTIEKLGDTHAN